MLVTGKQILDKAHKEGYAVGAFNVNNMEILQAVIAAAEEEKSPVIIQTSEGAIKYAGAEYLSAMVHLAANKASVPVALHLDHGTTYETIISCIRNGWTSVMIDGSHHPLDENIAVTKEIIKIAHACGVSVEAELGRLGGVEDNISVDEKDARLTHPDEAVKFVKETGVDYLAIAIGTAHGKYKGEPKLDFERLDTIKKLVNIPIVLHGASGVPDEAIQRAVSLGVNKINIDTDVRVAFTEGVKSVIVNKPEEYDPRKICGPAKEEMKKVVKAKMRLFGCSGKA
ncbi:MAG: fructose-bisphosphate aldolase, class [Petroclostridium sp.]|jgi:fructose-bisphosphate aldolase class II|nr:class fructose,6-bisphosphate aldolase [Clostridia bacterium]MDK2811276.1 fructose-bisphosphate aldolase, class [Petroclostridium sp.]